VAVEDRISDMQKEFIIGRIERRCDELGRSVSVEEIQDMVIDELDQAEAHRLARHYSDYRLRHELLRKQNSTECQDFVSPPA
jgi:anaerobic ribonucleoside-triphosphate reductase